MRYKYAVLFFVVILVPALVFAEFYKYRDSKGVWRFTYNLGDVPEDQRPNIKPYVEVKSNPPQKEKVDAVVRENETPEEERQQVDSKTGDFNARQEELRKEYETLLKEKRTLDKQMTKRATAAEVRRYQKQVDDLNARIAAYQAKRTAYEKEVAEYNEKVSGLNANK